MGVTYLYISHDLATVKYFSDRVAIMHSGRIAELGNVDELFDFPLHPYIRVLISAIPVPDQTTKRANNIARRSFKSY
jgi:ABC-type oligopeptide transport system ATPase subunit